MFITWRDFWWLIPWSIAVTLAVLWMMRFLRRVRFRRMCARAQRGEKKAEEVLKKNGYHVIGEQVERSAYMDIDGEKVGYEVRADYLLKRGWRRYVAEVKTGNYATSPLQPHTRRQLLEYYLVYHPQAVLLVDGDGEKVYRVTFPIHRGYLFPWIWTALFFFIGFLVGQWILR